MSKSVLRVPMLAALALLPLRSWGLTNAVVGTCVAGADFTTTQSAVDAASSASAVKVCPGTYPEQVAINKPLTLTGLALGTSAVIVPPAAGFVLNGSSGTQLFAAQVLVQNAAVTINNIGVDANNVGQACLPVGRWVGIAYRSASGAIKNLAIRNGQTCADSTAILGETTQNLKITNNGIHDCVNCIDLTAAVNTVISSNAITQGEVAYFGVNLKDSPSPTAISSNTISGIETGIYAANSGSVSITANIITPILMPSVPSWWMPAITSFRITGSAMPSRQSPSTTRARPAQIIVTHNTISDCGLRYFRRPEFGRHAFSKYSLRNRWMVLSVKTRMATGCGCPTLCCMGSQESRIVAGRGFVRTHSVANRRRRS